MRPLEAYASKHELWLDGTAVFLQIIELTF
jgi:hypothetical protein